MDDIATLRKHLVDLLQGSNAHIDFNGAIARLPVKLRGAVAKGCPHTPWQMLEHIRIAQWDILEFSRNPKHVSPKWPDGYWPKAAAPPSSAAWDKSVRAVRDDMAALVKLVTSKKTNLFQPIPHGEGQTILREALLLADHNAYHVGQLVLLRRLLGAWKD